MSKACLYKLSHCYAVYDHTNYLYTSHDAKKFDAGVAAVVTHIA